jgi:hypothetical protein
MRYAINLVGAVVFCAVVGQVLVGSEGGLMGGAIVGLIAGWFIKPAKVED